MSLKRKRTANDFKIEWLSEFVETPTPNSHEKINIQLKEIFVFNEEKGVICIYCRDGQVRNDFVSGKMWDDVWKLDFLKRHLISKSHLESVQKLKNKNASLPATGLVRFLKETPEEREKKKSNPEQVKILIDSLLLAIKMNISLLSVQEINNHMEKYVHIPESWRSKNYAFSFLEVVNSIVKNYIINEIKMAHFHTLIVDESTDISTTKCLIIYFKFRKSDKYKTFFGGIIQLKTCDSCSIVSAILKFYEDNKIDLQKLVMFTSDGASVMLGKHNGVAAKLKQSVSHLVQQHCVAHRENLCISDAWKEVKATKEIETVVRTIYTLFSRSATKTSKFKEIIEASQNKAIAFKAINEVRWLSRHFAIKAIITNYESLIEYFNQDKDDPISKFCLKKLNNIEFQFNIQVLSSILEELSALCKIFQRRELTPIDAYQFAHAKINKIKEKYNGNWSWNNQISMLLKKANDLNITIKTDEIQKFINHLRENLEERFPTNEVEEWISFDMSRLLSSDFNFGLEEIEKLSLKYNVFLADKSVISEQYNDFKYAVREKLEVKQITNFEELVMFSLNNEQFNDLSKLLDIGGTFLASNADCERGFSLMNSIKTKQRNRLQKTHMDMLMRVKSYMNDGNNIDLTLSSRNSIFKSRIRKLCIR